MNKHMKKAVESQRHVRTLLKEHGSDILHSDNFIKTRKHLQHGTITVYKHSLNVAKYSLLLNRKWNLNCNKRDLVRGALLHDYFLYDWHDKEFLGQRQRFHGFHHPMTALRNAEKEYKLNNVQREIIKKHMWPLSVVPPMCREAWVVTVADKYCSFMETIGVHKGHGRRNN